MPALEAPVHPLHNAVRHGASDEEQLLVTNGGEFFGNALNGAVQFLQAPAAAIVVEAAGGRVEHWREEM